MLIIEGPDGAGKTTLIKSLQEAYPDLKVAPRVVSKQTEAMVDMQEWVNDNLRQGLQYTIFDRYRLISEFIYGPLLRAGQSAPGFNSISWVHGSLRRFQALNPVIVYCLPPLETIKANLKDDTENSKVWDHIDGMYSAYLHRAALDFIRDPYHTVIYDYTMDSEFADPLFRLHHLINDLHERVNS